MLFIESETLELKRELTTELKKEIIAFANTASGIIYIGIEDNGIVCGVDNQEKIQQQISSMVNDSIKPDVTMFVSFFTEAIDNKKVIKIIVQRGTDRPYYIADKGLKPSGVYIRFGNTSIPATATNIRNMIIETDGTKYEDIRSLNQELTFNYASIEFNDQNLEFGDVQKKTLGLINPDGIFSNLGLLISDQCLHTVKIAVFEGLDKSIFKDRREFKGSVLKQLFDVFEYIDLHNHTRATFSGLIRLDSKGYSDSVIREALLNAIIHREYSFSGSILVNIFDDRIEFVSIGGLVPGLSINDIMIGVSQSRNEKLAGVFYRLRHVESYGVGIGKIYKDYEGTHLVPNFKATDGAFLVVLPNKNYVKGKVEYTKSFNDEIENKILLLIESNVYLTRKTLEKELGLKQTKAGLLLKQMEEKGFIKRMGAGKNTRYYKKT
jgi:ATP-dependent DNA helicase RecG